MSAFTRCSASFRSFSIASSPEKLRRGRQPRWLGRCTFIWCVSSSGLRIHAVLPAVYPWVSLVRFISPRKSAGKTAPWSTAALAGPLHFYLVYQLIRSAYPSGVLGLVPAAFALPSLLGLFILLKRTPLANPARNA